MEISRTGAAGLLRTPSADVVGDGKLQSILFGALPQRGPLQVGDTESAAATVGFLPRLEFGFTLSEPGISRGNDLAASAKYQVLTENYRWPALAVGLLDLKSQHIASSKYAVLEKHFLQNRLVASAGLTTGGARGGFAGLQAALMRNLSGVLEYDTRSVNYGIRGSIYKDYVRLGIEHLRQGWSWHAGLQLPLFTGNTPPGSSLTPTSSAPGDPDLTALEKRLRGLGLENVSVGRAGSRLEVAYENRAYPHNAMDALAAVLFEEAAAATAPTDSIAAVIKQENLPIMRVSFPLKEYREFMAGHLNSQELRRLGSAEYRAQSSPDARMLPAVGLTYGRADLTVYPGVVSEFATDNYLVGAALSAHPYLVEPLAQGLAATAGMSIPIGGTFGIRTDRPLLSTLTTQNQIRLEQLDVHYTIRRGDRVAARAFAGRFLNSLAGGMVEAVYLPDDGRWLTRATAAVVHNIGPDTLIHSYEAEVRRYVPDLDLTFRATAGRYLSGDHGVSLAVQRRFGDTEVVAEYRNTSIGKTAALSFSIPLGPRHLHSPPAGLRLRPPDYFDYGERTLLGTPNFVSLANLVDNELTPRDSLVGDFLGRNRINPAYVMRSLPLLRDIAK